MTFRPRSGITIGSLLKRITTIAGKLVALLRPRRSGLAFHLGARQTIRRTTLIITFNWRSTPVLPFGVRRSAVIFITKRALNWRSTSARRCTTLLIFRKYVVEVTHDQVPHL
jgi:hypothetical protein